MLDPNILACRDRDSLLQQLIDSRARVDYTQGLDAIFVDDDIAKLIGQTRIKSIHFAFDLMKNEAAVCKGLETFSKHNKLRSEDKKVYVLTNFNTTFDEDMYRVRRVIELGYKPDVRIYQKGTENQFLTDLQGWANNPRLFYSTKFADFRPKRKGNKTIREIYGDIKL